MSSNLISTESSSDAFQISLAPPAILSAIMIACLMASLYNVFRTHVKPVIFVIIHTLIRTAAFLLRIYVSRMPEDTEDQVEHKITVLIIDSIFFTAGYFMLVDAILGLELRWVDPSGANANPWRSRGLKSLHLAIMTATALSIYGGFLLANLPQTPAQVATADSNKTADTLSESKLLRIVGIITMLAILGVMAGVIILRLVFPSSAQNGSQSTLLATKNKSRAAAFLLGCIGCLAARVALSYIFVSDRNKMTEEKWLYGIAIAPELPVVLLLCLTPCLRWFLQVKSENSWLDFSHLTPLLQGAQATYPLDFKQGMQYTRQQQIV
ncbi:hypothetical protein HKX48_004542 [Thoreauomyces humboldtii]|nr:hypothetical protein HKX48_004542 [Thoreauomyces humboldtii]